MTKLNHSSLKEKLCYGTYISLFLALFCLPLKTSFSNVGLGLLVTTSLISFFLEGVNTAPLKKRSFYLLSPIIFFVPVLIGAFYSQMKGEAFHEVIKVLFFLFVPLLILRKNLNVKKLMRYGAYGLIAGSIVSAVILLSINFYRLSLEETLNWHVVFSYWYTNMKFVAPLSHMHPIYIGSYYAMALIFLLNPGTSLKKWLRFILSLILLVAIVFLNSRITYFSTFVILFLFFLTHLSWKTFAALSTAVVILFVLSLPKLEQTYAFHKFVYGTIWDLSPNIGTHNTSVDIKADSRMSRWIVAWEVFLEKPVIGHGSGTERELLDQKYVRYHMKASHQYKYNTHNQFLSYMVLFGVFGLALLLIFFSGNFYLALRHKKIIFIEYLIMILGILLIENYLYRNMGINFIAVFSTLFYLENRKYLQAPQKKLSH